MAKASQAPWKRPNPRKRAGKASKHLSPDERQDAEARARRAGRRYPNLVDNMKMASKKAAKKSSRGQTTKTLRKPKRGASEASSRKTSRSKTARGKDPAGGLSAAGREALLKRDGSHLKPGVKKKASEMTLQDMRRKGSWAVRFYGRSPLPPLVDRNGKPTRLALSAHAWGEPVPKTVAAARRIAAKGERLLARYRKLKAQKGS